MGAEGYLVSPTVFKTDGGGGPAPVSSILTCPRHTQKRPSPYTGTVFFSVASCSSRLRSLRR